MEKQDAIEKSKEVPHFDFSGVEETKNQQSQPKSGYDNRKYTDEYNYGRKESYDQTPKYDDFDEDEFKWDENQKYDSDEEEEEVYSTSASSSGPGGHN